MRVDDEVMAAANIGGLGRDFVPAGSRGRVVTAGVVAGGTVRFVVLSRWRVCYDVEIDVSDDEVQVRTSGWLTAGASAQ
jgi:hypothetical protein